MRKSSSIIAMQNVDHNGYESFKKASAKQIQEVLHKYADIFHSERKTKKEHEAVEKINQKRN